jgi:hypothetical protein
VSCNVQRNGVPDDYPPAWFSACSVHRLVLSLFFFLNTWCGRSLDLLAVDVDVVDVVAVVILVCLYWIGRSGLLLACLLE